MSQNYHLRMNTSYRVTIMCIVFLHHKSLQKKFLKNNDLLQIYNSIVKEQLSINIV